MRLRKRSRYFYCIGMFVSFAVAAARAAEVRPASAQEWDVVVKRAEQEGQVSVYANRFDRQRADDLGSLSKALPKDQASRYLGGTR